MTSDEAPQPGRANRPTSEQDDERSQPESEPCEVCGAPQLVWRNCKLICTNCRSIIKSCADL